MRPVSDTLNLLLVNAHWTVTLGLSTSQRIESATAVLCLCLKSGISSLLYLGWAFAMSPWPRGLSVTDPGSG
ncbi:hypothetical protein KIPB_013235 [Kipferlia bialata]|uniref:Uncharacterized protein n=1 Tax=Kipferlia bialata TaxID=797122 RepID=A0A391NS85_9EUKA|nr:hypothetical protein KIPB_013235 [Kipferlia bialata]|eukprot:g13235.t1